jgi:hypothetical protein
MSEIDRYLDSEIVSLAIRNGWSYDSKTVTNMRENLKARGFFINEAKEIVSPSDESFGSAIGELWGEPAPGATTAPTVVVTAPVNSGPKTIFDAQARERQLVEMIGTQPPASRFKPAGLPPGMSAAEFEALSPEEKMRAADEAMRIANNLPKGGVGF